MKHTAVIDKLKEFNSQTVFFEPLGGNNGDNLIEMGAMEIFKNTNINLQNKVQDAATIIINGSGDLSYHPASKPIEETRQAKYLINFPDKPVILLPSSSTPINVDRLIPILKNRNSQTILFARDSISFDLLKKLEGPKVEVYLDHDMAFGLYESQWLKRLSEKVTNGPLLVVERFDAEGATSPPMVYRTPIFLRSLIPNGLKNLIKRKTLESIHKNTSFVTEASDEVRKAFPSLVYADIKAADISLPQNYSFDSFAESVATSCGVVSTRLHVCILAALLGKPFIAVQFEGGNKLKGVFDHSLKNFNHSKLWIRKRK